MQQKGKLVFKGTAHKLGDNIDTDVIIPARYLNTLDPDELASHCMEDIDKNFSTQVKRGDIIVGGENFGCGSSREHAPLAIKSSGVSCVIASSFARIFYRNAINIGLPILESRTASEHTRSGDLLEVDFKKGTITNMTSGESFVSESFPEFMQEIINMGGLVNRTKQKLEGNE